MLVRPEAPCNRKGAAQDAVRVKKGVTNTPAGSHIQGRACQAVQVHVAPAAPPRPPTAPTWSAKNVRMLPFRCRILPFSSTTIVLPLVSTRTRNASSRCDALPPTLTDRSTCQEQETIPSFMINWHQGWRHWYYAHAAASRGHVRLLGGQLAASGLPCMLCSFCTPLRAKAHLDRVHERMEHCDFCPAHVVAKLANHGSVQQLDDHILLPYK